MLVSLWVMEDWDKGFLSLYTDSTLNMWLFFFFSRKEVLHFLRGELSTEATGVNAEKSSIADKLILENEKKCLEKMEQDPPHDKSGAAAVFWNPVYYSGPPPNVFYFLSACLNISFHVGQMFDPETCKRFIVFLLMLQVCTAVVSGMAGCAGMIHQRELIAPKTAPIIFWSLTRQVSSERISLFPDEFISEHLMTEHKEVELLLFRKGN